MAQHGIAAGAASVELPDSPTQVDPPTQAMEAQVFEMAAQMVEIRTQMAALQAELQSTKAQNAKLRSRGFGKLLDEDELEYTPPGAAAGAAAADDAAPAAPAIPASFLLTPQQGWAAAASTSWTQQGWVDYGVGVAGALAVPPEESPTKRQWIDWGAPPVAAAQQPQKPPGFADPWQQHADPWQQRGWVDWSAQAAPHAAPPPPASWQQWPGGWQRPDSWQHAGWGAARLRDPDRKDVEPMPKYSGVISEWLKWQKQFVRFLRRQDWRWEGLLERVQELRGKPVTREHERQWELELQLGDIRRFKDQLHQFLECYTKDLAKSVVDAHDEHNVLDAWRLLAERGHSLRPSHVNQLQKKALWPREAVASKDLEQAIASWERDVLLWEGASQGERMPVSHRKLTLEEMCPERLRAHLRLLGPEKLQTYEAMRIEISDWLFEEHRKPAKQGARACEGPPSDESSEIDPAMLEAFYDMPPEDLEPHQLMALVRNLKAKKGKGKGKGGPRKCFECDAEGHIASDCPIRAERIKNGGPERLDKPDVEMGKGKGGGKGGKAKGKGKGQYPPKSDWKGFNPDPSVIQNPQWMRWHPANKPQLKSLVSDAEWWNQPGHFMSISPAKVVKTSAKQVETKNRFQSLQTDDLEETEIVKNGVTGALAVPSEESPTKRQWSRNKAKTEELSEHFKANWPTPCGKTACCGDAQTGPDDMPDASSNENREAVQATRGRRKFSPLSLKVFIEKKQAQCLMPISNNEWEYIEFILDSGATTTVIPLHVGKEYDVLPSDASKAGVMYEIADGTEIPNLGEKLMPVVTAEGAWKGLRAQVADVSKALQSVRSLVRSGHVVVFGDGEDGSESYIVNKFTGECTAVKDDGVNYLLGLHIAPRSESGFVRQ